MLLRATTIDENTTAYFQGKLSCSFGAQQYMKIFLQIFKVNHHAPWSTTILEYKIPYFQIKHPCLFGEQIL